MNVLLTKPFEDYPALLFGRVAARSAAFGEPDVIVGAAAGTDEETVRVRARAELVERAGNILAGRRAEASRSPVPWERQGAPAVDPKSWPEFSAVPGIRERPMIWVPGVSFTGGAEVLLPGCAVYLRHRAAIELAPGSVGLAAHRTVPLAQRHGLLEVLERDLIWHAWYGGAPRAVLADTEDLTALGLCRTALVLPGPGATAAVLVCLADQAGGRQSFGARAVTRTAEPALRAAVRTATHEALMVRWSMGTPSARSAWNTRLTGAVRGALGHALHTYHRQDSLGHLTGPAVPWPGTEDTGGAEDERDLARVVAEHTGQDVYWIETGGYAGDEWVVGRVVAPGARRLPVTEKVPYGRGVPPHPLG